MRRREGRREIEDNEEGGEERDRGGGKRESSKTFHSIE